MKTAVYQSFRTHDVPPWVSTCLNSVRNWAQIREFEYRFFDDSFFDLIPDRLQSRASAFKCLQADYARLVAAKNLLKEGFDRVIWLDSDLLIFNPTLFVVPVTKGYAFSREVWLQRYILGRPQFKLYVNNAVSVFCQDERIIDFALHAADSVLTSDQPLFPTTIGTEFLSRLRNSHKFPLLLEVGAFGPNLARAYLENDGSTLRKYLQFQTSPIYAANLCLSHSSLEERSKIELLINSLQADCGESFNKWFKILPQPANEQFNWPLTPVLRFYHAMKLALGKNL